jgi:low affinity Fe/Cu permease
VGCWGGFGNQWQQDWYGAATGVGSLCIGTQCDPGGNDMRVHKESSWFLRFARRTAHTLGSPYAFAAALAVVVVWAATGPLFGFGDTWQLVINTGTTIVTFLMVFLIQNTQNRDAEAVQVKLDELIRAVEGADNSLLDMDELKDDELERIRDSYIDLAERARGELQEKSSHSAAA